jgi:hypothetical protein
VTTFTYESYPSGEEVLALAEAVAQEITVEDIWEDVHVMEGRMRHSMRSAIT